MATDFVPEAVKVERTCWARSDYELLSERIVVANLLDDFYWANVRGEK